jgi:hypothetical protein
MDDDREHRAGTSACGSEGARARRRRSGAAAGRTGGSSSAALFGVSVEAGGSFSIGSEVGMATAQERKRSQGEQIHKVHVLIPRVQDIVS